MGRRREIRLDNRSATERKQRLAARPAVREERHQVPGQMVTWRGHSGKRYVFKFSDPDGCPQPPENAVLAAVKREGGGASTLLLVSVPAGPEDFEDWRRDALDVGATEIQAHTLCDSPEEAWAVVEDLGFEFRPSYAFGQGF